MTDVLKYDVGSKVSIHDRLAKITAQIESDQVLVEYLDDDETEVVNIANLKAPGGVKPGKAKTLDAIPEDDLEIARQRFAFIEPLLNASRNETSELLKKQAELATVSVRTLQRWIRSYTDNYRLSDLAPARRGKRKTRLSPAVEAIIKDNIEHLYLNKQRRSKRKVIDAIKIQCKKARLQPPHANTIRARINATPEHEQIKRRKGAKAARDKFGPVKGEFPGADYPLAYVQIDHTLLDIILVDDEERLPIGRPWLTLAIDVFSRMVTGMYISLDAPSAFSVGMCMQHSILQKHTYMETHGLKGSWPVWGIPHTLHADNGKDFRSRTIQKACEEYGINLEWRPVKRPEFGGHIERLLGTFAKEIHSLPGTTFSNVQQRGEYKSEKMSAMTFSALETYLAKFITEDYHKRLHRNIDMSPLDKWNEGVMGKGRKKGIGMINPIADPERLRIDFLPYEERTVQRDGITWDHVHYLHDRIRHLIGAQKGRNKTKFLVRRDPRDIGVIYLLEPELGEYLEVPMRDDFKPSITVWDIQAAKKHLKQQGIENIDEDAIFTAREELNVLVATEKKTTKKTRRSKQRSKLHAPAQSQVVPVTHPIASAPSNTNEQQSRGRFELDDEDLKPKWEDWS